MTEYHYILAPILAIICLILANLATRRKIVIRQDKDDRFYSTEWKDGDWRYLNKGNRYDTKEEALLAVDLIIQAEKEARKVDPVVATYKEKE